MLPDAWPPAAACSGPEVGALQRKGSLEPSGRQVTPGGGQRAAPGPAVRLRHGHPSPATAPGELAERADLLVCESTYLDADADRPRRYGHLTAAPGRRRSRPAAGARRLVLTHFSQRYTDLDPLLAEARLEHDDVVLARDLDRVPVPPRHREAGPMSSSATHGLSHDGPDGSPRSEGDLL